jgi:hypothetical protein
MVAPVPYMSVPLGLFCLCLSSIRILKPFNVGNLDAH